MHYLAILATKINIVKMEYRLMTPFYILSSNHNSLIKHVPSIIINWLILINHQFIHMSDDELDMLLRELEEVQE